jgi:hypothetical protein
MVLRSLGVCLQTRLKQVLWDPELVLFRAPPTNCSLASYWHRGLSLTCP